jgi:PAS domain S-box-containing protein
LPLAGLPCPARALAILDSITDYAVIAMDRDGVITEWNSGAEAVLGWSGEEALGQDGAIIFTPEDRAAGVPLREMDQAAREGAAQDERWHVRRDGGRFWANGRLTPLKGADGAFEGFVKVLRDCTRAREASEDRDRAREALAEATAHLRLALEAGRMAVWDFDVATDALHATPQLYELMGWKDRVPSRAELDAGFRPGALDAMREAALASLEGDRRFQVELPYGRPDGSEVWLGIRAEILLGPDGAPQRVTGVALDITEARAREQALAESHDHIAEIIESIGDMFYAVDAEWRLTFANQRALDAWGLRREETIGRMFWDVFPSLAGTPSAEALESCMRDRRIVRLETMSPLLGRWIEASVYPAHDGLTVWFRDISTRKRAEEQRQLLVHELHHRVKNTLAVVQSVAAQTFRDAGCSEELRAFGARLAAVARAQDVLTREDWRQAPLAEVVREAAASSGFAPERFHIEGPDAVLPPGRVMGLSLALHELITNAVKYGALSRPEGRVEIVWTVPAGSDQVEIRWRERGGPPVSEPQSRGFGMRLLERVFGTDGGARVQVGFAPGGVECVLTLALNRP